MQYYHLKAFIAVVKEGNFSKAAAKLFVSPSALSQQITTLERSLDFKLFTRNYQGVKLTSAGEDFYPKAKEIIALTESAGNKRRISIHTAFLKSPAVWIFVPSCGVPLEKD